ncbi:MAG: ribosome small subunit-dependent GTPase A [Acidimicrobiales bacterium]
MTDDHGRHPLADIGFDEARADEVLAGGWRPESVYRVVRMDRGWATIQGVDGVRRVRLRDCPPIVVGDWLVEDARATLVRLERRSLLVRRAVSAKAEPQPMAANVDVVLVTWALDTRMGDSRLRDMLVLARESGARTVLALSKVDTADTAAGLVEELGDALEGVEVVTTSSVTGEGLDRMREITSGRTVVLLGSSGAGKSTLTNVLLGIESQETGEVGRAGEGRHTTTSRQLLPLPGGGAIIDTPGIRAATVWEDVEREGADVESRYPDLDALAEECRFSDCTHRGAPGCALDRAVSEGELTASRKAEYLAFVGERAALDEVRSAAGRQRDRDRNRRQRP